MLFIHSHTDQYIVLPIWTLQSHYFLCNYTEAPVLPSLGDSNRLYTKTSDETCLQQRRTLGNLKSMIFQPMRLINNLYCRVKVKCNAKEKWCGLKSVNPRDYNRHSSVSIKILTNPLKGTFHFCIASFNTEEQHKFPQLNMLNKNHPCHTVIPPRNFSYFSMRVSLTKKPWPESTKPILNFWIEAVHPHRY